MTAGSVRMKVSVGLGQHEWLLFYGPAFRPITVGQPLKGSRNRKGPSSCSLKLPVLFKFIYKFPFILKECKYTLDTIGYVILICSRI